MNINNPKRGDFSDGMKTYHAHVVQMKEAFFRVIMLKGLTPIAMVSTINLDSGSIVLTLVDLETRCEVKDVRLMECSQITTYLNMRMLVEEWMEYSEADHIPFPMPVKDDDIAEYRKAMYEQESD